ncbi:MAG: Gfo/Idh/MocA family oxidoreductase [Clostridiales bacterium]|nr:Gfo/Idh/MocA family oxidoreductase [Clostridiales bacterium]
MKRKYSITLIGAGDRGNRYMRMLKEHFEGQIEYRTVCDIIPDRMDKARAEYGFTQKVSEWEKALATNPSDIAVIAVPAYFHCDMAIFAMTHQSHALIEKPLDLSVEKCFKLEACQRKTGKAVALGMQYRNIPYFRSVKNAFSAGLFGENPMIHYQDLRQIRPKIAMHDILYGNGGPIVDMSCHLFDLMRWYYNSDPAYVSAFWRINAKGRLDLEEIAPDSCFINVEYENGSLGSIMLNWGLPPGAPDVFYSTVAGSSGILIPHSIATGNAVKVAVGEKLLNASASLEDADDLIHPERAVFMHLIEEIEGTGKSQVSIHEGKLCLAAAMAALCSCNLRRAVSIEEMLKLQPTALDCMKAEIK